MFQFLRSVPKEEKDLNTYIENLKINIGYHDVLEETLLAVVEELEFENISQKVVDLIVHNFKYAAGVFFYLDKPRNFLYSHTVSNTSIINNVVNLYTKSLREHGVHIDDKPEHFVHQTLLNKKVYEGDVLSDFVSPTLSKGLANLTQRTLRIKRIITLPVIARGEVLGVIMFTSTRPEFTVLEKQMLLTFTNQIALAIRNSTLFTKVQDQVEVLQQQNHDLASLFNLASQIVKSLDPDEVAQIAVNSLPQDELMLGAYLLMHDPLTNVLKVVAVTQNVISEASRKIMGNFDQYVTDLKKEEHIGLPGVRAFKTGQPVYTDSLEEAFYPVVPKIIIKPLDKLLSIKSIAFFPIFSQGNPVGVIGYPLKEKGFSELEETRRQLLQTYTTQIAISLENARLFTETKRIQASLEKALSELQAARDRERDMIDIMGHELRTPMSIVRNTLSMMSMVLKTKGEITVDKQKEYVAIGLDSARRESNLIETLLSATKADAKGFQLTLQKVGFKSMMSSSVIAFKDEAEKKGLQFIYEEPEEDIYIYADQIRAQEVVDNFISNAVKYTFQGSITLKLTKDKKYGYVTVSDTGIGIEEKDIKKLGNKFFRARQYDEDEGVMVTSMEDLKEKELKGIIRPGGTGLGLYVSFSLIKIMDGKLDIKSEFGKGSSFTVGFPLFMDQKLRQLERKVEEYTRNVPD